MPLVCLGYDVSFDMSDGRHVKAGSRAALLFDRSGQYWPACSVLVQSFSRGERPADLRGLAKDWFGGDYVLLQGSVSTPPREILEWKEIGEATRILYTRGSGDDRPARHEGDYEHPFGRRSLFDVFSFTSKRLPLLYRRGNALRLELGSGCRVTGRGFEHP